MIGFGRTDRHFLANWWWTIDRWLLLGIVSLMMVGFVMTFAASPVIAHRLEIDTYHFAYRQIIFLAMAFVGMIIVSLLEPVQIRRLAMGLGVLALGGVLLTLTIGSEIKGSTRWLRIMGFSLQPSEFLKPCFVVAVAWCFAMQNTRLDVSGRLIGFVLLIVTCFLLSLQPDIGQMILLTIVWTAMFFLAGGSYLFLSAMSMTGLGLLLFLYQSFPHFKFRVDRFLDPSLGGTYQTDKALEAFRNGGLFGTGPGDGKIKHVLPDGHTDYVFAVAAEEFGLVVGLLIICIFAAIILRCLMCLRDSRDHWVQLAGTGLIILFGMQTIINMAVNLNLMPPKGMTLPFISYGGSSLLALALTMGMVLALTRHSSGKKRILGDGFADEIPLHKTFNLKGGGV